MEKEKAESILAEFKDLVHSFNNKLSAISGSAQLIALSNVISEKDKDLLSILTEASAEFSNIANSFVAKADSCLENSSENHTN